MADVLLLVALVCFALALVMLSVSLLRHRRSAGSWKERAAGWIGGSRIGSRYLAHLETACVRGGRGGGASVSVLGLQVVLAALGTILALALFGPTACPAGLLLGVLPWLRLRGVVLQRQAAIRRSLPAALDLMGMTVECGLDFGTALSRSVERLRPGPLKDEFESTLRELRLGRTRAQALAGLRDRTAIPEISAYVTAVLQADQMGTPLGQILRSQVSQLLTARTQRAEALAAEAPVRMLLPLVVCIFPTVFLILLGPIAFAIVHGVGG